MMVSAIRRVVMPTVALVLLAGACGGAGTGSTSVSTPQPVKVGAVYPLTGSAASAGAEALNSVRLAAEIVNEAFPELEPLPLAGTVGLPNLGGARIEVISADHGGDPGTGATQTERLINEENVAALIGAYQSSVTAAGSERANQMGIPWVTGSSSSTALTEARNLPYFFRTGPNDEMFAAAFFDFLEDLEQRYGTPLRNIAILHEDTAFGTDAARVTRDLAAARGFTVVADVEHGNGVADVTEQAQEVMAAHPDVLFEASYAPEAILFTEAWAKADYAAPTLAFGAGFAEATFFAAVGNAAEDVISRAAWSPGAVTHLPAAAAVEDLYRQRYFEPMDEDSARTFTAALTLFYAINEAGTAQPAAIRDALAAVDLKPDATIMPWDGIRFGPSGQNELARGLIVQYQQGAYHVVWPFDLADAELVWPIPPPSQR